MSQKPNVAPLKRLTPDDVRKLVQVEPEIVRAGSELASRRQALGGDVGELFTLGTGPSTADLAAAAAAMEGEPELRRVLDEHEWTALEFLRTLIATGTAILEIELVRRRPQGSALSENARLLVDLPADAATAFEAWKQMRMGPAVEMFRQRPPGDPPSDAGR